MDSEKAPYFVVVALSAFAWAVGYFYDSVVTSPIVEFRVNTEIVAGDNASEPMKKTTIELQNISRDKAFPSIVIWLRPSNSDGGQLSISTRARGYGDSTNIWSENFKRSARVNIHDAQPHEIYVATVRYPVATTLATSFDSGEVPVRFLERGLVTSAIKWSQDLMIYPAIGIAMVIVGWLIAQLFSSRAARRTEFARERSDEGGGP